MRARGGPEVVWEGKVEDLVVELLVVVRAAAQVVDHILRVLLRVVPLVEEGRHRVNVVAKLALDAGGWVAHGDQAWRDVREVEIEVRRLQA